jgi:NAD(P)-dependent dehydrogenase (short-subunit alcohol dehydrogenase family)
MKTFHGKVAAITGAGSGIGRALAREGCELALSDIDAVGLRETQRLAQATGVRCTTAIVDVAQRDQVQAWATECAREHGRIHLLFNNAGVALAAAAESTLPQDFEWIMGINFWGVVHGTQAFMPHLRASGDGHVVNLSSVFGIMAMPTQSAYNASKFAVRGFTEALRMELDLEGVNVGATCVHPGGVSTNIVRSQRLDARLAGSTGLSEDVHRREGQKLIDRTQPDEAARQILAGVRRNARRVLVGRDARFLDLLTRVLGSAYQGVVVRGARRMHAAALR